MARLPAAAARPLTRRRMDDEAELVALRRRVRELEALEAVARAARAPIELDEALAALVESAAGSLHAEVCALAVASTRRRAQRDRLQEQPGRPDRRRALRARRAGAARRGRTPGRAAAHAPRRARRARGLALAPGRVQRARAGAGRGRGRARRDRARGRARRDARAVRARGAPPRQEQPADGRIAAAAGRQRRRRSRARAARLDRPRARDRRGARPAHGAARRGRRQRRSRAPAVRDAARARSTARSRPARWRPIVLAPERATALALVLCELAANAVEHGGGHGYVELRRDGAFVELTVSDHGQGPPPPPGTPGQGLSIARALVEVDLGGTPALRASTTACARPCASRSCARSGRRLAYADARAGLRGRDDHPARPRASCSRAPGSRSSARRATARRPCAWRAELEPDMVLMDVRMPELDGVEAARQHPRRRARCRSSW